MMPIPIISERVSGRERQSYGHGHDGQNPVFSFFWSFHNFVFRFNLVSRLNCGFFRGGCGRRALRLIGSTTGHRDQTENRNGAKR